MHQWKERRKNEKNKCSRLLRVFSLREDVALVVWAFSSRCGPLAFLMHALHVSVYKWLCFRCILRRHLLKTSYRRPVHTYSLFNDGQWLCTNTRASERWRAMWTSCLCDFRTYYVGVHRNQLRTSRAREPREIERTKNEWKYATDNRPTDQRRRHSNMRGYCSLI